MKVMPCAEGKQFWADTGSSSLSVLETLRSSDKGIDCRPQSTWKAKKLYAQGLALCTIFPLPFQLGQKVSG